jgi:hypothetical protein
MDLHTLRKNYETACFDGDFDSLKKIIKNYKGNDLEPNLEYSEALSWAIRRKHFDIAEYLLSSDDVKQNYVIPLSILSNLRKCNKDVTEFILTNSAVKKKFNVFGHHEDYKYVLAAACEYEFTEEIEKLILSPESDKFVEPRIEALRTIASRREPNVKLFDKILNQVLNHPEYNEENIKEKLVEWLLTSFDNPENTPTGLTKYLIFDKKIELKHADRLFIKETFPTVDKLFLMRELEQDLVTESNQQSLPSKKPPKL